MKSTKKFRNMLKEKGLIVMGGAYDAFSARIIEKVGFDVVGVGGFATVASRFGMPDSGLVTMTESVAIAKDIASAVSIPVVADAEDGFGNPLNVRRTVQEYCRAGVAAIHIEDVGFEKHLAGGGQLIPAKEMAGKIRAAVDARLDEDFVIIARTDAVRVQGGSLGEALARAEAYVEAGAEIIFMAGLPPAELGKVVPKLSVPLMNMNVPRPLTLEESEKEGLKIVAYPGEAILAAFKAVTEVMAEVRKTGHARAVKEKLSRLHEVEELVGNPELERLIPKYFV